MNNAIPNRWQALLSATRLSGRAAFAFLARSLQQLSTLVITLLAARFLPPQDYGIYSLGIVFIVLVQTLTYTGFYQFILTSRQDDALVLSTCFWLIAGLVSFASLVLAAGAWPLQWLFDAPHLGPVLFLLAALQPLASLGAWSSAALLRRGETMLNFQIMFAQNIMALIGGTILLCAWHSLYALVAFRGIRVLAGALLYASFGRDFPSLRFSPDLARTATRFSASLYGSRFLGFLSQYAADLLLGVLHSPAEVGLYRFGNRLATGVTDAAMQPMSNFAAAQLGEAARKGTDISCTLARLSGTIALLAGMLAATITVLADDAIHLFFQPSYTAALVVTYAMALRALAGSGKLLLEPAFAALGRTSWVMLFNLVTSIVAVCAIFATSPLGLVALAWGQVMVMLASTAFAFYLLNRHGGIAMEGCLRNVALAVLLATGFGLALGFACAQIPSLLAIAHLQGFVLQVLVACGLAVPVLALAIRLRVFNLSVFSG
ncbi:oligosaccharide flippase family protein [Novosphingobium profundi]|uniref:oligosaccharide flippase family protein n=1 Tax=Novosphingobium profundi TaxID=1774954 RepID=UPI001FE7181F|nr:oligosaccharide flippase family protein [Novosphingobium profundi]